jgi:hypothetical protein
VSDSYSNAGMAHHMHAFLAEMRNDLARPSGDATAKIEGRGLGAHGRVSATIGRRGHLTDLSIDGLWVTTVDNQTLVEAVKEAVCGAVDDVHDQLATLPPVADQMAEMVQALDATLNEISNSLARIVGQSASR